MAPTNRVNVCLLRRFVSVVVGFGMVLVVANGATGQSAYEVLHGFARDEFGRSPVANLIQARDGDFYGMTADGGIAGGDSVEGGTIFKITAARILTTLHTFDCSTEGCGSSSFFVQSGLFQARDGDFYGTTPLGGTAGNSGSVGTVFKLTPAGLTVLHPFDCSTGSCSPSAGLIQARDEDDFYGTIGGVGDDGGAVFKIAADAPSSRYTLSTATLMAAFPLPASSRAATAISTARPFWAVQGAAAPSSRSRAPAPSRPCIPFASTIA